MNAATKNVGCVHIESFFFSFPDFGVQLELKSRHNYINL